MTLTGPAPTIPRDAWDRPMVVPPNPPGAKPVAYTRATTVAKAIDNPYGLMLWKQRMTMLGLVARRDLLRAAAATSLDDVTALNALAEQAADAGGATVAATTGTALHAFTERLDRGLDLGHVPEEFLGDLDAYEKLGLDLGWKIRHVEVFTTLDPYRVAGTADRVIEIDGRWYIADIKTGESIGFPHSWAIQLAIYSRGLPYDPETCKRLPWEKIPDQDRGVIIHLPAGQGQARAYWIDLAAGWSSFSLALKAREWTKRRDLLTDYAPLRNDPILDAIAAARTVGDLTKVWAANQEAWTPEYTSAAAARKAVLADA